MIRHPSVHLVVVGEQEGITVSGTMHADKAHYSHVVGEGLCYAMCTVAEYMIPLFVCQSGVDETDIALKFDATVGGQFYYSNVTIYLSEINFVSRVILEHLFAILHPTEINKRFLHHCL